MGELGNDRFFDITVKLRNINSFKADTFKINVIYPSEKKLRNYLERAHIDILSLKEENCEKSGLQNSLCSNGHCEQHL